jgi:hypothetical protein
MRSLICALVLNVVLGLIPAHAERHFPQTARRGEITAHNYPYYTIDKKTRRLAAGGKIYNEHNMIIMPASLQRQKSQVMYAMDFRGELGSIWLLTPAEAAKYKQSTPAPKPAK